jgi:alpha-D-ribose 1-methylphosphonate 5-triphosphate synthase subunit PhnH
MHASQDTQPLSPGFTEPVHQAQQVFRLVLAAMAEPGTLQRLPAMAAPQGLDSAAWQVCLALLDQETPLWIAPSLGSPAAIESLRFQAGCPLLDEPGRATFALATPELAGELSQFSQGSPAYPDRSTTLILQVAGLDRGGDLLLEGPGIPGQRAVSIAGFDERWLAMLAANHAGFPLGVDLILCAGEWLMALPRTTQIRREA